MERPVAIVGAGMAGLACAVELERAGVPYVLLEASDRVGGKVQTDRVDGFLLDQGYQTLFPAYPHLARVVDPETLDLGFFRKGAMFVDGKGAHRMDSPENPIQAVRAAFDRSVSLKDKLLVGKWTAFVRANTVAGLRSLPDMTTGAHLHDYGFSEEFTKSFLRPFLGGIFGDRTLGFSRQQFAFLWKMVAEGGSGLPKEGMEAIPRALLAQLPGQSVRTYARVAHLEHTPAGAVRGVRLETHESLEASAVVLACSPREAERLLGEPVPAEYQSITTIWFQAGAALDPAAYLVLNGTGNGIVNNLSPSSVAQPSYAPNGAQLVGAMILGDRREGVDELIETARRDVAKMLPASGAGLWQPLRVDRVRDAHLKEPPGYRTQRPSIDTRMSGVYLAGEVTTNASLDGAVESGLRAARKAMGAPAPDLAHV
ncbi:FAD-dependent oxidoreductase [bacterium]|nr:MAG: FAD-dependent oxidoreductase [bacterium]